MAAALGPGVCGPSSRVLRNAAGSVRLDQSVRISTQEPAGMRPCPASHASTPAGSSKKSSSAVTSREQSMTQAGAISRSGGIVSVWASGRSRPVIQCAGASKWVPVCSPQEKLFQYQAGPRAS